MISVNKWRPRLHIIEQVRVIADFLQLHQNIEQLNFVLPLGLTINHVDIARQDVLVKLFLHLAHANVQIDLFLRLQGQLYV